MAVTMKDIADKCGVSKQTVSMILGKKEAENLYSSKTRKLVQETARELKYHPNFFARSLKQKGTNCIGLMGGPHIADLRFPYMSQLCGCIEQSMRQCKTERTLLVFGAGMHQGMDKNLGMVKKGLVDGLLVILLSSDLGQFQDEVVPMLNDYQVPFVVLHSLGLKVPYHSVGLDTADSIYQGTKHLFECGAGDVRFYTRKLTTMLDHEMYRGFTKALLEQQQGNPESKVLFTESVAPKDDHYHEAYRFAQELQDVPEGIIASSDVQAAGLYRGFLDRGVDVPGQVQLVGRNGSMPDPYHHTHITHVANPLQERADAALAMLQKLMADDAQPEKVESVIFKSELVVRGSTRGTAENPADGTVDQHSAMEPAPVSESM